MSTALLSLPDKLHSPDAEVRRLAVMELPYSDEVDDIAPLLTEALADPSPPVRLEAAKHHAIVESAVELDEAMTKQLTSSLRAKYGKELSTEFKVSPELLGGLRIRVGSDVIDGSVRERLRRLEAELTYA